MGREFDSLIAHNFNKASQFGEPFIFPQTQNLYQMKCYFYVLYSPTIDKFYIGHTQNLKDRLIRHNQKSKGFTGSNSDWKVIYTEEFDNKSDAYARERQVKKWKSRDRVIALIQKQKRD